MPSLDSLPMHSGASPYAAPRFSSRTLSGAQHHRSDLCRISYCSCHDIWLSTEGRKPKNQITASPIISLSFALLSTELLDLTSLTQRLHSSLPLPHDPH